MQRHNHFKKCNRSSTICTSKNIIYGTWSSSKWTLVQHSFCLFIGINHFNFLTFSSLCFTRIYDCKIVYFAFCWCLIIPNFFLTIFHLESYFESPSTLTHKYHFVIINSCFFYNWNTFSKLILWALVCILFSICSIHICSSDNERMRINSIWF